MSRPPSNPDPEAEYRRQERAKRRLGTKTKCTQCGATKALIPKSKPRICAECQRKNQGQSVTDNHHVAGKNNHAGTVPVPVNDHRARLSLEQHKWPARTLRNPDQSPLLAIAACIRGFIDFVEYCIEQFLVWAIAFLEELDARLVEKFGPRWWDVIRVKFEAGCL